MKTDFDVIIIGGSYAGLSAGMALGRSLRDVLIIDSGKPCNLQTPHSHNLITHDGDTPLSIATHAKQQVLQYPTVTFKHGLATHAKKQGDDFLVTVDGREEFAAKKLLFTTGVLDVLPDIPGIAECWGVSVLHCPYCHGFEVKHQPTGILANGEVAFEYAKLISNWTNDLTLFTNGESALSDNQSDILKSRGIKINSKRITAIKHNNGMLRGIVFTDGSKQSISAMYHKAILQQHCKLPEALGCQLNDHGFITINQMQETTVMGVYAAGDNTTMFRSLAIAIADGSKAGAIINKQLIDESF